MSLTKQIHGCAHELIMKRVRSDESLNTMMPLERVYRTLQSLKRVLKGYLAVSRFAVGCVIVDLA